MRGTGIILIASNYTKILIPRQHTVNTFKQNVAQKKIEDDPQKAQNDETRPHGVDCMQISCES